MFVRRRAMELRCDDRSISTTTKESVVLQLQGEADDRRGSGTGTGTGTGFRTATGTSVLTADE